jgi:8-amino-3,8-dideoxy-alpha-D-manno-octulosonate transaminase
MKSLWPREFPGVHWYDQREQRAAADVLRRGTPFRYYGMQRPRHVEAFEAAARRLYGVKYALAVNSGTGGLSTAMAALGVGPGDEVIVPSLMWVATIGAVVNANAIPVLCEVNDSFNMDAADLQRKITPRTRLILPVHMSGAPCDMRAIMAIARRHKLAVLEDCAQCNGGSFRGKKVGTFGDVGMFSLQVNKNCTTGEGGLLVTSNKDLYWRMAAAHDVGAPWVDGGPKTNLGYVGWGSGRRMGELTGAVAAVQLSKLPRIIKAMRASKQRIKAMLADVPGLSFRRILDAEGDTGCFMVLMYADAPRATAAVKAMHDSGFKAPVRLADFGMHVYYHIPQLVKKIPLSPAGNPWKLAANRASVYDYGKGACPQSDELFARSVLVPIPSCLTRDQERWAAKVIRAASA